jgi:hypothetical protein
MEKQKLAVCLLLLSLVTFGIFAYVSASGSFGFEVYETHTRAWHIDLDTVYVGIPKSFNVTVECKKEKGEFLITYHLEISGPESLCNDYLRLGWRDTDGADFIIGKEGEQFSGTGTLTWNSSPVEFKAEHKNNITLTLIFLTLDALGDYNAKMWVAFTEKPIEAQVRITPKILNIKSHGRWITAHILLPEPHKEKNIDINSVKLWYNGDFVQAEWGIATKHFLMVKFSRGEVIKMLESEEGKVNLIVTGLVNGIEFYGTDTITIIAP